jgi:uncharacterized membrane protein YraQ (UPF0718 family)
VRGTAELTIEMQGRPRTHTPEEAPHSTMPTYALAALAGTPLYVCEGGRGADHFALLRHGLGPGPALTLLLGSVGTCVPTMLMARGIIGRRAPAPLLARRR